MKIALLVVFLLLVALVIVVAAVFWSMSSRPLYEPGMVNRGENLNGPLQPPAQNTVDSAWIVEQGVSLFHESHGEGRNVIVVHGGPGVPYDKPWKGLAALQTRYRFFYYHQRGAGQSSRPFDRFESKNWYANMTQLERTLGIGAQVADIERIRRLLGDDKLILIGHSFGGFLAAMYACEFPQCVESLVLVAPAGVLVLPNEDTDLFKAVRDRLPEHVLADYDALVARQMDFGQVFSRSEDELAGMNREFAEFFLRASGDDLETESDSPTNGGWMVQAMYFSMGRKHDYRAQLQHVDAPVLVVHGKDDQITLAGSRAYVDCFPNAEFQLLEPADAARQQRAGHFVFNDLPEIFAATVDSFLSSPASSGDERR